jgi:hypothetical protein
MELVSIFYKSILAHRWVMCLVPLLATYSGTHSQSWSALALTLFNLLNLTLWNVFADIDQAAWGFIVFAALTCSVVETEESLPTEICSQKSRPYCN